MAAAVEVVLAAILAASITAAVLLIDANAEDEQLFREELAAIPTSRSNCKWFALWPKR